MIFKSATCSIASASAVSLAAVADHGAVGLGASEAVASARTGHTSSAGIVVVTDGTLLARRSFVSGGTAALFDQMGQFAARVERNGRFHRHVAQRRRRHLLEVSGADADEFQSRQGVHEVLARDAVARCESPWVAPHCLYHRYRERL